jgi:hypothetical protein
MSAPILPRFAPIGVSGRKGMSQAPLHGDFPRVDEFHLFDRVTRANSPTNDTSRNLHASQHDIGVLGGNIGGA